MTRSTRQSADAATIAAMHQQASRLIDLELDTLLSELAGPAPLLHRMCAYHLGMVDHTGQPVPVADRRQGKRMRPQLALLSCAAAGGEMANAAPLAAAIELLHNFTLVHDDIQDRSPTRRHRPTVWKRWGDAQAINAGDALFATAQLGVLNASPATHPVNAQIEVARAFNRMTIDIVRGQVLDLDFEGRHDVAPDDYLEMIQGKTAAIVRFSAWAGALFGGAAPPTAQSFARFGEALGVGFQLRDDALGVWGAPEATGKDTADDIRRRKTSLPVLLLRAVASDSDRAELDRIFATQVVPEHDVQRVLTLMDTYHIHDQVEARVEDAHDTAIAALDALPTGAHPVAVAALRALTDRMAARSA